MANTEMVKKSLKRLLEAEKITQEQYDEAIAKLQ